MPVWSSRVSIVRSVLFFLLRILSRPSALAYNKIAPASTPTAPAAAPARWKFVGMAPLPEEVLEPDAPAAVFEACATWMPKEVLVATLPEAVPVVTVEVTTEVAVVEAAQPVHVVQGALVPQGPDVQPAITLIKACEGYLGNEGDVPLQVLGGQACDPHQLVHGPAVQEPLLWLAQGPQPFAAPPLPNGPCPLPAFQPGRPVPFPPGPNPPKGPPGAAVVCVAQLLAALCHAEESDGHAPPPGR